VAGLKVQIIDQSSVEGARLGIVGIAVEPSSTPWVDKFDGWRHGLTRAMIPSSASVM
jgi:hypothetical protein